jgi:hypothetical protein
MEIISTLSIVVEKSRNLDQRWENAKINLIRQSKL